MARWAQGVYEVRNPQKYIGNKKPMYRSGWELTAMRFFDMNENIIQWASESIQIPYRNPLTGKQTVYIPDFFVMYRDKTGLTKAELIEIKPSKQTTLQEAGRSQRDRAAVIVNQAKWASASLWCKKMNISFRIITEHDLFRNGNRR
jgi:hypothetical protein